MISNFLWIWHLQQGRVDLDGEHRSTITLSQLDLADL
eukprot:SAG31_NODE_18781_length_623_cov_0.765267_1_plen_36_part_10